jgi:hypothetical protein
MFSRATAWFVGTLVCVLAGSFQACTAGEAFTDFRKAGPDIRVQGEYTGTVKTNEGKDEKVGVQVIALGDGKFEAVGYPGGLPGDGWVPKDGKIKAQGQTADGVTTFKVEESSATIKDRVMKVLDKDGKVVGELKKVRRQSSTVGAKAPAGAVVLFDGTNTDALSEGKMSEDKLLNPAVRTKQKFEDYSLHLEFRIPFMPKDRGQGRGNSGLYLHDCYELQILDSFGLEGENNECGGFYTKRKPDVNMCYPPLAWQTYDIDFTAAKFENGKKVKNAVVTVRHNGVVIHENYELPGATPGGSGENPGVATLFLQNHGNPVQFRNFWVVEKK